MEITQLIERCRQRDAEALSELYMTYSAAMRNVCRRYLSDKQAIDDVVHDSFVIIYTSLDTLRDTDKAVAWMMSITRNVASKYKDYQKKHPTVLAAGAETKEPLGSEVQDELTGEIALSELKNLVDKLPEGYGQVFRLAVFEGLSHKEIAALLNIEPHSSASQLARAKKMLRNMMLQSWPILLLLLFPILYFIIEKEKPIAVEEEKPIVAQQEETPKVVPVEPEPLFVQQSNSHTVISSADRTQLVADYTSDTIAVDTLATIVAQEESVFDTVQTNQIQSNQNETIPNYELADIYPKKQSNVADKQKWSLGFAYAGNVSHMKYGDVEFSDGPHQNGVVKEELVQIRKDFTYPISYAVSVRYKQNKWLGVESGIIISRHSYDFVMKTSLGELYDKSKEVRFLGIPAKLTYNVCMGKKGGLYGNLGLTMGIPLRSYDGVIPWQWSVGTGLGLQYNIARHIGIFTEPSVQYQLPNRKEIYDSKNPYLFTMPVGIKFIW